MHIRPTIFAPAALLSFVALAACQTTGSTGAAPEKIAASTPAEFTIAALRTTLKDRTFACETAKGFAYRLTFADTAGDAISFTYTNGKTGKSNAETYLVSGETVRMKRDGKERQFFDLGSGAFRTTGSRSPSDCQPVG